MNLAAIKKRLGLLTAAELEAFATHGLQPGPLATALGIKPAPPPHPLARRLANRFIEECVGAGEPT